MPVLSPAFIRDNPWWKGSDAVHEDADLLRFERSPVRFEHSFPFRLDTDAVYTLRGPRQVGKSTLLKRLIRHLIAELHVGPRRILYTDVEGAGFTTGPKLRNALSGYLAWARSTEPEARLYVFLDEVTGLRDWGAPIRALYREGVLRGVTVVATGSHALDLARGGETAPGRRGEAEIEHPDWVMMPLAFRDYVKAHLSATAAGPRLALQDLPAVDPFSPRLAAEAAQELVLHGDTLGALFDRYLLTGGYPHAMAAEQERGVIPPGVYDLYRTAVLGQMKRAGHRESLFREIVSWAADHRLGQEFSWQAIAGETDIGSKDTARRYVEDAEALFLWHVLYRAQDATTRNPALRSPKKLYPADPFSWHVLAGWAEGTRDPWAGSVSRLADRTLRGHLVEAVAADHAVRAFGRFALYHRTDRGDEEIDLILHREAEQARLEIKCRPDGGRKHARPLAKYGGGVLVTVDDVAYDSGLNVARVPLYALLAGSPDSLTLFPAHPA